jgi:hypothetical protein
MQNNESGHIRFPTLHTHKSPESSGLFYALGAGQPREPALLKKVWRWAQSRANSAPAAFPH